MLYLKVKVPLWKLRVHNQVQDIYVVPLNITVEYVEKQLDGTDPKYTMLRMI